MKSLFHENNRFRLALTLSLRVAALRLRNSKEYIKSQDSPKDRKNDWHLRKLRVGTPAMMLWLDVKSCFHEKMKLTKSVAND
ncbi:MAG TPA: hypothetical protein VIJ25_19490 [Methylococcales bacterium]